MKIFLLTKATKKEEDENDTKLNHFKIITGPDIDINSINSNFKTVITS